jgi:hypothetical protein
LWGCGRDLPTWPRGGAGQLHLSPPNHIQLPSVWPPLTLSSWACSSSCSFRSARGLLALVFLLQPALFSQSFLEHSLLVSPPTFSLPSPQKREHYFLLSSNLVHLLAPGFNLLLLISNDFQ